ncbi:hypothetical protein [Pseudomonas laurylsulfatiphila]|uniref:hypothetical protein n=1 Tax=Pseudomonas laurylsulfatiphila TaxID=2011015 RepID=UPI003D1A1A0F
MKARISEKDLEELVLMLNKLSNTPTTFMSEGVMNVGHYHISCAYGGYALHQLASTGGSVNSIWGGYCPKRELYNKIELFISGIEAKGI